jgi:hypothetical protein
LETLSCNRSRSDYPFVGEEGGGRRRRRIQWWSEGGDRGGGAPKSMLGFGGFLSVGHRGGRVGGGVGRGIEGVNDGGWDGKAGPEGMAYR